jgi:uncharacterized protein YbbC (DUF1343 family)/CubicO group peptidase (beta-lactamase class C family)
MGRLSALALASFLTVVLSVVPSVLTLQPLDDSRFAPIADIVTQAIADRQLPGAVVLIGRGDAVVYSRAFGNRTAIPSPEPMTDDTIFDLASLTKVVATTTSVMKLVEDGKIRLNDPVTNFIPEFGRHKKSVITIRQLMAHLSGLRPDLELDVEFTGADEAIRRATEEVPVAPPGERFIYSDINFFVLGDIVRRVTGERLDRYAKTQIFDPLGMTDTMFLPPDSLKARIAPTERCAGLGWPCGKTGIPFLRGVVHDPTARRMGGVAGHAGLFSTAADLSRFCRMLLGGGRLGDVRILSDATVARMVSPATPADMPDVRGLGWDIDSTYSANRGELFPVGSFGHTGFTGTSLWLDPHTRSYVVFLSNRVHPDGKGDVTALRGKVATVAAAALYEPADLATLPPDAWRPYRDLIPRQTPAVAGVSSDDKAAERPAPTLPGIDVLEAEGFARLRGKRVALLTNQTGRTRSGKTTIDALFAAPEVKLVALYSPEHGIRGELDEKVPSSRDEKTGLPIYSLYGESLRPTAEMLQGIDAVVVDLQDIGARFYTYPAATGYLMEEAAKRKVSVVVLDRPNPVDGFDVEGPMQDWTERRYTSYYRMPIRHGLTLGELASLFNDMARIGADLTVVPMKNWRRDEWFDETALAWLNPSPNMRNMLAATLYPGIGALEGTNVSVGRGTDTPFEQLGAPWIDGVALASALNARALAGIRFYPVEFTPAPGAKLAGQICQGVFMIVTDRERLRPVRVGLEIASALWRMYGQQFRLEDALKLFGSVATLNRIRAGDDPAAIASSWRSDEANWRLTRAKYLLY